MFIPLIPHMTLLKAVLITLVITHLTIQGVTVFLHRCQAHRALNLSPSVSHFFRFWLWLTTGMVTKEWVAVHRKHHTASDVEGDPHSPHVVGLWEILWRGVSYYRKTSAQKEVLEKYGIGTPDDAMERHFYLPYHSWGVKGVLPLSMVLLFGIYGIPMTLVIWAWIPFWAAGVINGVGHYLGYRNYHTADASRNIVPWGVIIGGEELHNNHHAFPTSAKFSTRWWEFDLGWLVIRILSFFGLAQVKHRYADLHEVDQPSVSELLKVRMPLLEDYTTRVIMPIVTPRVWHRIRSSATRLLFDVEPQYLSMKQRRKHHALLLANTPLQTVCQYKQQLTAIFYGQDRSAPMKEALVAWCQSARESGINALVSYADGLEKLFLVANPGSPQA